MNHGVTLNMCISIFRVFTCVQYFLLGVAAISRSDNAARVRNCVQGRFVAFDAELDTLFQPIDSFPTFIALIDFAL